MKSNKKYVQLLVDYKSSVSQAGFPRTLLGVPREIMELKSMNFEMSWKISNIPQNITGISVQQLEILTTSNNITVIELHSSPTTSSNQWVFL